jgi:hypothetical protein
LKIEFGLLFAFCRSSSDSAVGVIEWFFMEKTVFCLGLRRGCYIKAKVTADLLAGGFVIVSKI